MKQKNIYFVVLGLLAVASCAQKEDFAEEIGVTSLNVELPNFLEEGGTRSQINVSESDIISYSWAVGDALGIFPDEGTQVSFRLTQSSISADGKSATFDGGGWALKSDHTYYAYFPFNHKNTTETSSLSAVPLDYTGQSISFWYDKSNAGKYDFNAAGGITPSSGSLSFQFQRLGALLRLRLTLPSYGNYQKLTLSTDDAVIPVKGTVNLSATTLTYTPEAYDYVISVNLNNIWGEQDQQVDIYLMLPPMNLQTQNKPLTAMLYYIYDNKDKIASYDLCKAGDTTPNTPDFTANTIYKRNAVGGECVLNGHDYVDLGLSVKWATCNIGATSPEKLGDVYAWGWTDVPFFGWGGYPFCSDYSNPTMTKYNKTDGKTVLDPEDDTATVIWGDGWRMPTIEEMKELINKCTWTWSSQNGVNGYTVTSNNGNSIFLPVKGSDISDEDKNQGHYWTSSLCSFTEFAAESLNITSYMISAGDGLASNRNAGLWIRPVCQ